MLSSHLYTPIYKSTNLHVNQLLVGGFNPLRKICWSNWIISNLGRGENKKCLKQPPTRLQLQLNCHLYFHLHLSPMKFLNGKKPGRLRCWSAATEVRSPMDLQCLSKTDFLGGFHRKKSREKKTKKQVGCFLRSGSPCQRDKRDISPLQTGDTASSFAAGKVTG